MPTRTLKLEIVELAPEHRKLLYHISQQLRQATNHIWRIWETHHTTNNTPDKLRSILDRDAAWRKTPKAEQGPRPKWDVTPFPREFQNQLGKDLLRRYPSIHSRVLTLLYNNLVKNICTKQSIAANTKWWIAILLDLDRRGCSMHPQPINIDKNNAKIGPADEKGRITISFRTDRIERPHKKRATATLITAKLKTGGKRTNYSLPAHQIALGTRPLKGSQILYDQNKKKWFAILTYEIPKATTTPNPSNRALLKPGKKHSWLLRLWSTDPHSPATLISSTETIPPTDPANEEDNEGRTIHLGGRGRHIAHKRHNILTQRLGRSEAYKHAHTPRKGSGKNRALLPTYKLQQAWNHFTKRCNQEIAHQIHQILTANNTSHLTIITGKDTDLLATAGKIPGRTDSTSWPWYQAQTLIQQKCNLDNIKVTTKTPRQKPPQTETQTA